MAEIHARRGALEQARDIYLRTAEIYVEQGFQRKAMTVYKSVLKLTPGLPHVRERLADTYRQQGMVADALRELELCRRRAAAGGQDRGDAAGAAQDRRAAPGQHRVAHPAGRDGVAGGQGRRGGPRAVPAGGAAEGAGAGRRLRARRRAPAVPPPHRFRRRARAGGGVHRAPEPAARADQAADGAEGGAARSRGTSRCWPRRWRSSIRPRRFGVARAGRDARRRRAVERSRRRACAPRWRWIGTDGETKELAARWGVAGQRRERRA